MFKELKMKIAARRVERKKARKTAVKKTNRRTKRTTIWTRARELICRPFRAVAAGLRKLWAWIRSIDLIGLVNLTLLIAIIALFSMLIIDVINCRRGRVVVIANDAPVIATPVKANDALPAPIQRRVSPRPVNVTLPIAREPQTRKMTVQPVNVVPVKKSDVAVRQIARTGNDIYGDTIIDSRAAATVIKNNTHINGNLYLQNMRKYTLPCGVVVRGNLFLRDVNMLQFCGDFTVTGNIYVSPRSSFGPIPRTARLGGQVIL